MQNETLVETLRRSWLNLMDADANRLSSSELNSCVLNSCGQGSSEPHHSDSLDSAVEKKVDAQELQQQVQILLQQNQALLGQQQLMERDHRVEHDYLGTLGRISRKLQHSLDETEMFQTVIQELVNVLNLVGCQVRLYNADGSMVIARHEYIAGQEQEPIPKIRRVDFPLEGLDISAIPSQFCNLNSLPYATGLIATGIQSIQSAALLQYPLIDGTGILGSIQLERSQQNCFSSTDLEFIEQVAAQCAIALRRNRFAQINKTQTVELKHLNQLQDAFLGTVSYELRIPLANIRMAIQMITLALTKETNTANDLVISDATLTKILRYLEVLQRECDRETKLIQDLLDLQQLDMDTLSLVMSTIDLEEWLPYVISPFQKRAQEYNLDLQYQIPSNLPAFMCDQITLSRIVSELVGNATKYTPAGGKLTVNMEPLYTENQTSPHHLRIRVCNTGVEIPIEEQGRIFEKFYRLTKLDIRKLGGTGLGLALVDKLVQRLDGKIELHSSHQQTCFVIDLPFQNELRASE